MDINDELLGKPYLERVNFIKNQLKDAEPINEIWIFSGEPSETKVKVYMIDIDFPIYRLKNIRTKGPQKSYIAKNQNVGDDFFSKDPELREALAVQHELLLKIASTSSDSSASHVETFETASYDKQHPMMMTSEGVLVNGNTRMSALRHLYDQNPAEYNKFSKIPIAVLPSNFIEKDFRKLELNLQINRDIKKDYSWISEANDCREQILEGVTLEQLSKEYGRRKNEAGHPTNLMNQLKAADLYLDMLDDVNDYDLLEKEQYALWAWWNWRSEYDNDLEKQDLVDLICFDTIKRKPSGIGNYYTFFNKKAKEYRTDPSMWDSTFKQYGINLGVIDGVAEAEDDVPEAEDDVPEAEDDVPVAEGDVPEAEDDVPEAEDDVPVAEGDVPEAEDDVPEAEDDGFDFFDQFENPESDDPEDEEISNDDKEEIIKKIKKQVKSGKTSLVETVIDVSSTKAEEKKRAKDLNLIYSDSVELRGKVLDCIKRLENETKEFNKLSEAKAELLATKDKIDYLCEIIETRIANED